MARKRCLFFLGHQLLIKLVHLCSRRLVPGGWLTYLFLACLSALLFVIIPPVFANFPTGISVTQNVLTAPHLLQQGREQYEAGQFAAARQSWQQAAQAYQSQGDSLNQAMVLSDLALANRELGQLSEATDAIASALKLLQSEPDTKERTRILAQALNTQGSLQMALSKAQQALSAFQQATDFYKQAGDEAGVIRSLLNQTQALRVLGLYRRALSTLTQINQTLQEQPDSLLKATGLRYLGNSLRLIGNLKPSQEALQQSLTIAQKLSSPPDISAALLSLGNTVRAQQDTEAALQFYQKAAAGSPKTKIQAQLNQLSLIVEGGVKEDRFSLTQSLLSQIKAQLADLPLSRLSVYARINFAQSLIKLATGEGGHRDAGEEGKGTSRYGDTGNSSGILPTSSYSQAPSSKFQEIAQILATAIQQAKTLKDRRSQAYALGSLGGLYEKTQQRSEAQNLTQQALVLTQSINAPDIAYRFSWQLGRLLKAQGNEAGAIAAYTEAVDTLKSLRSDLVAIDSEVQFSFRESVEPIYREFVSLLLKADDNKTSSNRIEQARKAIESLQLAELDNFFRTACLNALPVQIDAIDRQAAVIYPIILPDRLEVILSLPQQPLRHYATSLPSEQVERTVRQLRVELIKSFGQRFLPLSQQVYDWLVRPTEADLQASEIKTLVFVLDGSLRNIPMAVLHDGTQYLMEKYDIALTPGLELLEPQPLARNQLKVLTAGLSEARQGFPALPQVEAELNQIQSQIPGEVLLNQRFTKTSIQNTIDAVPFSVIHLATHGQFSSKAEDTFILTWDDRINVNDLDNLLRTTGLQRTSAIELLVLSACQTAKGDNRAALGIAGVALRAGARSTLATLWSVDDEGTAQLMSRFYQELANAEVTKAEALRRAQQSILQDPKYRQHPYYWAGYVLVGNWL